MIKGTMKLKMIPCVKCLNPMPELRKIQYGYSFCVDCSTVEGKVARFHTTGTGEEIMTGIQIMEPEEARRLAEIDNATAGIKENIDVEYRTHDKDEQAQTQKTKENVHNTLNPIGE